MTKITRIRTIIKDLGYPGHPVFSILSAEILPIMLFFPLSGRQDKQQKNNKDDQDSQDPNNY